ncbi:RagB/SusD family nutrient uptake outer membrane protein [Pedobacter duraquae]|uniref:Putative outer membrane starch-binding protein n=1 Tax=Pedobacter duraquae TaxID=425511 RepID=A0A4R6IQ35_9SPHI|nr:RagB/SusD family nutrient uptake outer membrane protein [Pedobacter duraquae]TDO24432.1 putative outer membrane starch-binding protein [Pedobacter duraquae]
MKNRIFKCIIIAICLSNLCSCTKLDEEVYSSIPADNFFRNEAEVITNVGRIYAQMRKITDRFGAGSLDLIGTDECIIPFRETNLWYDNGLWIALHRHAFNPNLSVMNGGYTFCFDGIAMCNQILYQLQESKVEFAGKDKIFAEVKVARAYFYYKAMDWFGNIPISTDFKDVTLPKQRTRTEVWNFIVKDINDNLALLDDAPSAKNYGRTSTKAMANMLLAKLYLNAEKWTGVAKWDEAIAASAAVIATPGYTLSPDYFTNFKAVNNASTENIFVVPYDKTQTPGAILQIHCWTLHTLSQQTFGLIAFTWDGYAAMEDFYKSYDAQDKRIGSWLVGPQVSSAGKPLMLSSTRQLDYRPHIKALYNTLDPALVDDGVRFKKYEYEAGLKDNESMSNDWVVFRYADALATKAEALMRKNGNQATPEAVTLMNQIRFRAFGDHNHDYTTGTLTMNELLAEIGREFAWEFHRRQDLIRFNKYNDAWYEKTAGSAFQELYPLPTNALNVNSNLKQNPGY